MRSFFTSIQERESTILKNNYFHQQKQWLCFPYTDILSLFRRLVHENNSEIGNRWVNH